MKIENRKVGDYDRRSLRNVILRVDGEDGHDVLFLAEINFDGNAVEIPLLTNAVFEVTLIRFAHVLRQVAEKGERGDDSGQLCHKLDADHLVAVNGRRSFLDDGKQVVVELGGGDATLAVFMHLHSGL